MAKKLKTKEDIAAQAYLLLSERAGNGPRQELLAVMEHQLSVTAAATQKQSFDKFAKSVGTALSAEYNPVSPSITRFAREESSRLVTRVTDSTRQAVAEVVATELEAMRGIPPAQRKIKARLLADDLSKNKGLLAGLDANRMKSVLNYKGDLEKAGYSEKDIQRKAEAFSKRQLSARAKTISQTEMRRSVESAQIQTEKEMGAKEKSWETSRDDKVSDQCWADHEAGWIPIDEAFPSGNQEPPGHPNCRCTLDYRRQAWEDTLKELREAGVIDAAPEVHAPQKTILDLTKEERAALPLEALEEMAQGEMDRIVSAMEKMSDNKDAIAAISAKYDAAQKSFRALIAGEEIDNEKINRALSEMFFFQYELSKAQAGIGTGREALAVRGQGGSVKIVGGHKPQGRWSENMSVEDIKAFSEKYGNVISFVEQSGQSIEMFPRVVSGSVRPSAGLKTITMGTGTSDVSLAHEMGHLVENQNGLADRAAAWRDRRTAGDVVEKMSDLFPDTGYDDEEVCKKDKFKHPYTGRIYDDGATEVISTGLEYIYENPLAFAREDPDHFRFTIMALRGWL